MARYLSSHTMACMTRQAAQQVAEQLAGAGENGVRFLRFMVNMTEGKLFGEFEAPGRDQLLSWLEARKMHFDWISRIDLEASAAGGVRDL